MGPRGWLVFGLGAAVLAAVAAAATVVLLGRGQEPASVEDAVAAFRAELGGRDPEDEPLPEGVYVYATEGYEKTDALVGVTNRYPPRSTITITRGGCGFRMRWDVTEGRSTTWTVCTGRDGWLLASQDERHTFFGRTERTTYRCVDTPFRPADESPGSSVEALCATGAARERGRVVVVGRELVSIGGKEVDAVHIRRSTTLTGTSRGRTRHDVWLNRVTSIPVQLVLRTQTANDAPVGEVLYEEDVTLRLESLDPRR
jgi:hypothetical protein